MLGESTMSTQKHRKAGLNAIAVAAAQLGPKGIRVFLALDGGST